MNKSKYYKHPQFGQVYGELTATPAGRLVWPSLVTPKDPPPPKDGQAPGQPRYELTILLKKGEQDVEGFIATITEESKAMLPLFNEKNRAPLAGVQVVQDGDAFDAEKYPYYQGHWVLVARNTNKPTVCDKTRKGLDPTVIVGGVTGKLGITPMITKGGMSYKLNSVQMLEDDGTRFGGGTRDVTAIFEVIGEESASEGESEEASESEVTAPPPAPEKKVIGAGRKGKGLDSAIVDRL